MTMLRGCTDVLCCNSASSWTLDVSFPSVSGLLTGTVDGAVLAARASKCLVTLFKPITRCDPIAGTGGGEESFEESCVARFRFLPFEG